MMRLIDARAIAAERPIALIFYNPHDGGPIVAFMKGMPA
jgi:hypothetical protein